jgi:hypothetical protein
VLLLVHEKTIFLFKSYYFFLANNIEHVLNSFRWLQMFSRWVCARNKSGRVAAVRTGPNF